MRTTTIRELERRVESMEQQPVRSVKLKSIELDGFSVELLSEEGGKTFRVNVEHEGQYPRTRVFVDPTEAFALFESYRQGN